MDALEIAPPVRPVTPAPASTDGKPWWLSKGVVGSIVSVVAVVLSLVGYQVAPEAQAQIVDGALALAAVVGSVVALVGRLTASKRVV